MARSCTCERCRVDIAERDSREWRETAVNAQTQVNRLRTFLEYICDDPVYGMDARQLLDSIEMETP